jgi:mRNA interferase MazF
LVARGEIYLVSFDPARGVEQRGVRPALVIQGDEGNAYSRSTIVAALSTSASAAFPFRVPVRPSDSGLRESSTVMLDQITTVTIERLRQLLGLLSRSTMDEVDRALHYSLGLVD